MEILKKAWVTLGCDPEFFFRDKDGKLLGSEKVLPKGGLTYGEGKMIIDGAQAELNPKADLCRELLGSAISDCFKGLAGRLKETGIVAIPDFSQTISLSQEEMDALSDDCKKFGCMSSKNAHKTDKQAAIKVNPAKYMYRSAGGHIHMGHYYPDPRNGDYVPCLDNPKETIKVLDVIVGNTCVLIDRALGNVERRKNYGRAGEYRTPSHGLEYRTLSNFWLANYTLMSLVMGLTRMALDICHNGKGEELLSLVKIKNVEKAINTNNVDLARANFEAIEGFLSNIANYNDPENANGTYPICGEEDIALFYHFIKMGVEHWFEEDIYLHWLTLGKHGGSPKTGFNSFLKHQVRKDLNNSIALDAKALA